MMKLSASATVHAPYDEDDASVELIDDRTADAIYDAGVAAKAELDDLIAEHTANGGLVVISDSAATASVVLCDSGAEVTVTCEVSASSPAQAA